MNRKQRKVLQRKIKATSGSDLFFKENPNWITFLNARAYSKYSAIEYRRTRALWKTARYGFVYGMSANRLAGLIESYGKSTKTALEVGRELHKAFSRSFAELEVLLGGRGGVSCD